jgi:hypothetical protein
MRVFKTVVPMIAAWTLGLVCFAAFLKTLEEPVPLRVEATAGVEHPTAAPAPDPIAPPSPRTEPRADVIELDPIVIVAPDPRARAAAVTPPETNAAWTCDAWRPLVQGGFAQRVRSCELPGD